METGRIVVQLLALLPCSKMVLSSNPSMGSFCMEFACSLCVELLTVLWLPSKSKNMTVTLIGLSKIPLGISVCACAIDCPVCLYTSRGTHCIFTRFSDFSGKMSLLMSSFLETELTE
ncbi:hypothetical protein XENOCAPTIV_005557 [Xenoophorus captivus]|uniref:Secreted protein n=1 Tax=Xenoophorus captivus TaxID=1517983 RepID=A0ABV0RXT2_9TELE